MGVTLWQLNMGATVASLALLVGLLYVYSRNLRTVRTPFGIGLLVFALLFVAENLASLVTMMTWTGAYREGFGQAMLIISLAEVAGFSVLLAISWS